MVDTIFCTHGKLTCTTLEPVQMAYGDTGVETARFVPDENAGNTAVKLEKLMSIHNHDEWLTVADLQYGSPWSAVTVLTMRNLCLRIISGLSLLLAFELAGNQDNMNVDELHEHLTQTARQVCVAWEQVATAEEDF